MKGNLNNNSGSSEIRFHDLCRDTATVLSPVALTTSFTCYKKTFSRSSNIESLLRHVTPAISQNNKTAAMLVSQTNPVGVKTFS